MVRPPTALSASPYPLNLCKFTKKQRIFTNENALFVNYVIIGTPVNVSDTSDFLLADQMRDLILAVSAS